MRYDGSERRQQERRPLPTYYYNASRVECFPTSVANLLLEWGDDEMAARIWSQFWTHELAKPQFASLLLLTRYVSDLTDGRYRASIQLNVSPERLRRMLDSFPPRKREAALMEMMAGRIRLEKELILDPYSIAVVRRSTSHALTYLGGDRFIDDGRKKCYPRHRLRLVGVVRLERVEPEISSAVM
jgi:hypothetical protein